jgi:hypothetical protein
MKKYLDSTKEYANPAYVGGCGYPLCSYYRETTPVFECPFPIEGSPCEGIIARHEASTRQE